MSFVLFKDSFQRYDLGAVTGALFDNLQSRYTIVSGTLNIAANGRAGQCVNMGQSAIAKVLPHSSRWVAGFAYRRNQAPVGNEDRYTLLNNDNIMCRLLEDADGTLSIHAGNSNVIAVTNRALNTGRWYFGEIDMTLSGGTPISLAAELRINGHVEASGSGSTGVNASSNLSFASTGGVDANFHQLSGATGVGNSCDFDDLYIKNEGGYEGDIRNVACFPNGDGGTLQWTPNSGSTHFDRVNSHPVDLTKWLETALANNIDIWDFDDLPTFSGQIVGINISVLARKDDEGTKSFKIVVGDTGTEASSDEFFVSDVTPEYYEFSLKLDPATGLAWTRTGFNAKKFGVKLIS